MTEFEKHLARQKYRDLLREYRAKEEELRQLAVALAQQRSVAGIEDQLPGDFAETPERR